MTETDLQQAVAAYVNREVGSFVQGEPAVNLLRVAINNAKKWAQRKLDFELARTSVRLMVNAATGGSLSSAQDDTGAVVAINRIEMAHLGYGGSSNPLGYRPIKISSKRQMSRRSGLAWKGIEYDLSRTAVPTTGISEPTVIRQGNTVYVYPVTPEMQQSGSEFPLLLDVIQWMPDYDDIIQTDFFLEHCSDWLMYRSMRELNFFIKDANRMTVTSGIMNDAWDVVVAWNTSLSEDDDTDLS